MNYKKILEYSELFYKKASTMQLFKEDGSPYTITKHEMVSGTQEEPELAWIERPVYLPSKPVGAVFNLVPGGYGMPKWFKVIDESIAVEIPYKLSSKLQSIQQKIERNSWLGEDSSYLLSLKEDLEELKKSI